MIRLSSYVNDQWKEGTGDHAVLVNPSTEEPVAEASTSGIDMASVLEHARTVGGPALREMTFAQRGDLLQKMANALHDYREELLTIAEQNNGGTRGDADLMLMAPPEHWPAMHDWVPSSATGRSWWMVKQPACLARASLHIMFVFHVPVWPCTSMHSTFLPGAHLKK